MMVEFQLLLNWRLHGYMGVEHYKALDDEARQYLPLRPIYFLAPEE